MDNDVLAKLNAALSRSESTDLIDMTKVNFADSVRKLHEVQNSYNNSMKLINEHQRLKEEREEENRENLRKTAENSDIVIEKLEMQIQQNDEDLQNQRELIHILRQQLNGISRTLSDLFILEENNQELQEEANILAREIYSLMVQGKKIDWKSIALDKGIDIIIAAIPIILQLAKVIS